MLSTKTLIRMARKWQRLAKASRKRISFPRSFSRSASRTTSSPMAEKGHFVVYTADERRFALPLVFLQSEIFRELLRWAEEEFGSASDGPITLPFDSVFMEYAISIIERRVGRELEETLVLAISHSNCSLSSSSAMFSHCGQIPVIRCR